MTSPRESRTGSRQCLRRRAIQLISFVIGACLAACGTRGDDVRGHERATNSAGSAGIGGISGSLDSGGDSSGRGGLSGVRADAGASTAAEAAAGGAGAVDAVGAGGSGNHGGEGTAGSASVGRLCSDPLLALYGQCDFYTERSEAEQTWQGTLVYRVPPDTPNGRDHEFWIGDLPVYAGNLDDSARLKAFDGASVELHGKLIYVSDRPEIWPSCVECAGEGAAGAGGAVHCGPSVVRECIPCPPALVVLEQSAEYVDRAEPEQTWQGTFTVLSNPRMVDGVAYECLLDDVLVYTADSSKGLEQFHTAKVEIRGKLVDDGTEPVIWPATIECVAKASP